MDRKLKNVLSLILTFTLIITSAGVFGINGKADEVNGFGGVKGANLTGIEVTADIVKNGDSTVKAALESGRYNIGGADCNNYAGYAGVTAGASSVQGENSAGGAVDGNNNTRWESRQGEDPQYLNIDFGNVYSLKGILIYWEAASAAEYTVEVSEDGYSFSTLTEVSSTYGERTDNLKFSQEVNARAVRIYCKSRTTTYGDSIYEIGFFGTEAQKEVVPVLSNLHIEDYYRYTGKYIIYFNEVSESAGYNVYIDDDKEPVKVLKASGEYLDAEDLKEYGEGEHQLYITNTSSDGKESAKIGTKISIGETVGTYQDIPQIYIYTAMSISTEYHEKADVTVSVADKEGGSYKDFSDSACNIKIRGNTTAWAEKKPWNIKLSGKQSILGMDKGKKWCLLANSFDKSLMRNSLSYDFGLQNGVTYTCQSRFADVYINGVYNGNYLITEPVEAKKERVDVDAYNADSNDILLELGTRNEAGVDHFTTNIYSTTFDVNDPEKGDDLTDAQVDAKIERVKTYLNEFENALRGRNYNNILNYIDEDTFVNFYIVNELFKNVDFNFSSTRFYIKDDRIYAGPLWDFDLSSGNCRQSVYADYYVDGVSHKGFYCQSMNWYRELLKNEEFYNKIKSRYADLQYVIQNIYKTDSTQKLSINHLLNLYGKSFERNYMSADELGAGWSLTNDDGYSYALESGWTKWMEPVEFLRTWLLNRNVWLCEQWNIDMQKAYEESAPSEPETTTAAETTDTEETTAAVETTAPETTISTESTTVHETTGQEVTTYADSTTPESQTTTEKVIVTSSENKAKKKTVKSKRVKVKKAYKKRASKKAKVTLKKVKKVSGYQVKVSLSKKFKKKKTITRLYKKHRFTVKRLKSGRIYYVKARAYIKTGRKKRYGRWSKIRKVSFVK